MPHGRGDRTFRSVPLEWRFAQGCSFTKGDVKMVPAGGSPPAAPTGLDAKLPLHGDKARPFLLLSIDV